MLRKTSSVINYNAAFIHWEFNETVTKQTSKQMCEAQNEHYYLFSCTHSTQ